MVRFDSRRANLAQVSSVDRGWRLSVSTESWTWMSRISRQIWCSTRAVTVAVCSSLRILSMSMHCKGVVVATTTVVLMLKARDYLDWRAH